ncbi:MAG: ergothioneine biosynthesis protein EgtB [Deltaproteobacteria bacterium]|nr:ergothioneine biosynthesis protein EgtB [Deltaproteobacteria bacterium]
MRTPTEYLAVLEEARNRTLRLVAAVADPDLRRQVHSEFSPVGWHLGHIGVVESFWLRQQCQRQASLSPFYDFFFTPTENPKTKRGQLPPREEMLTYLSTVRAETARFLAQASFHTSHPLLQHGNIFSMLLQHEEQHLETMLIILQLLGAAQCESVSNNCTEVEWRNQVYHRYSPFFGHTAGLHPTGRMNYLPERTVPIGSDDIRETLDNERPRHEVRLSASSIDQWPVTNGEFIHFVEDGGYERSRYWTTGGWRWCQDERVRHPRYWRQLSAGRWIELDFGYASPLVLEQPVRCVSWYEADAYARWVGKRLPTEAEWEYAATSNELSGTGRVWEWTSTWFHPYPGFRAHPYEGYSVPYFDQQHRVLRGGSWVTQEHIRRSAFRNWYHPGMRAIFSGFRCAKDDD